MLIEHSPIPWVALLCPAFNSRGDYYLVKLLRRHCTNRRVCDLPRDAKCLLQQRQCLRIAAIQLPPLLKLVEREQARPIRINRVEECADDTGATRQIAIDYRC
jgi:hypothetical protein